MFGDWLPAFDALLSAGRRATPAGALETAVRVAAERLRGRVVTVRGVPMTVTDLAVTTDTAGLLQGRIDEVRFAARDVGWPGLPVARLAVRCHDVRVVGPLSTRVVIGSVRLRVAIPASALGRPPVAVRLADGQVWLSRPPWPGALRVVPEVAGGALRVRPVAVRLGRLRVRLARPAIPVDLPDLPPNVRVTAVSVTDAIEVDAHAVDWRDRVSGTPLTDLLGLLGTAATTLTVR
ncbi:LmeA family phospholipid-binding protein [Actinokineospora sp. NPDC004072]